MTMTTTTLHAATGGIEHRDDQPWLILLHGAGNNRTVWAHQARYFASRGWNVLSYDLPGHGQSEGPAPRTIQTHVEAVIADLDERGVTRAAAVGHSMGALIALQLAGERPQLVSHLGLVGGGLALAVADALLSASEHEPDLARDAVVDWAFSSRSHIGGAELPGSWLDGAGRTLIAREIARHPDSFGADFAACAAYDAGPQAATQVTCPAAIISGSQDMMTRPALGRAAAEAIADATYTEISGAGHMLMAEAPTAVTKAMNALLTR